MSIQAYCEYNAGTFQQFVPREADVLEFDQPVSEGIEVREHATLGDYLREFNTPPQTRNAR